MTEPQPYRWRAENWLRAAYEITATPEEMDIQRLEPTELSIVAADLDGIREGCEEVVARLKAMLGATPRGEAMEDALVASDLALSHAAWHWNSLRERLVLRGLWDAALIDDGDGSNET